MKPANGNLDRDTDDSVAESDLEAPLNQEIVSPIDVGGQSSVPLLFRYNKLALMITSASLAVIAIVGLGSYFFLNSHAGQSNRSNLAAQKPSDRYAVTNIQLEDIAANAHLIVGQNDHLDVNGQLKVSNTVVLTPTAAPASPTAGQIYYNSTAHAPYYFNGSQFISLAPTAIPQHVSAIGGVSGSISVGDGLQVTASGQLSLSSATLQAISAAQALAASGVGSGAGAGAITGSSSAGQIALFTGSSTLGASALSQSGNAITASGNLTATGSINATGGIVSNSLQHTGAGSSLSLSAVGDSVTFTDGNRTFTFPAGGGLNQQICTTGVTCAAGGGIAVLLQPGAAQIDTGAGSSLFINNTGGGNLLQLQGSGNDRITVNNAGQIIFGADTNLYRSAAGTLKTDQNLVVGSNLTVISSSNVLQTNFTQNVANSGVNVATSFVNGGYTPGLFFSTQDNNPTKPKAGIYTQNTGAGSNLLFGTSNSYAAGITNTGLILDYNGSAFFQNATDSFTGFQIKRANGNGVLAVDTQDNFAEVANLRVDNAGSIMPVGVGGVDNNGIGLQISGGQGTGLGVGGDIHFGIAKPGVASGSNPNPIINVIAINGGTGAAVLQNVTDTTTALNVVTQQNNTVFDVDTLNGRVGIRTTTPSLSGWGMEIQGALKLSGGTAPNTTDNFITPVGATAQTKINIPLYDPGAFSQILSFGLPAGSSDNARAIGVYDARATVHQPALGVFNPQESDIVGFSWENSGGATAYVKTIAGNLALRVGSTNIMTLLANGNVGIGANPANGLLTVGTNTAAATGGVYFGTDTNLYRSAAGMLKTDGGLVVGTLGSGGTTPICTNAGQLGTCGAGAGGFIINSTALQTTANFNIQSGAVGDVGGVIQDFAGQTADLLQFKNSAGTILSEFTNGGALQGPNASGANTQGGNLAINGGQGTGNAWGGNINFQIATPGVSGSGLNSLSTVATIYGSNGALWLKPVTDTNVAFNVQSSLNNNVFTVDTLNGRVGIGLSGNNVPLVSNQGLEVRGALRLDAAVSFNMDSFDTPAGSHVPTAINIPLGPLPAFSQDLAFGVDAASDPTARGIIVVDARTVAHQPTIDVASPNENQYFGLTWEGSNTTPYLKSSTDNIGFRLNGALNTDVLTLKQAGGTGYVGINTTNPLYGFEAHGSVLFQPLVDTTNFLQIQDAGGASILTVDSVNKSVIINNSLSFQQGATVVNNNVGFLDFTGAAVSSARSAANQQSFGTYVTGDSAARLFVQADGTLKFGSGSGLQDVSLARNGVGGLTLQSLTNSTTAFQVKDSTNTSVFTVDTSGQSIAAFAPIKANVGLTVGVAGTTNGVISLANNTSSRLTELQAISPTGSGNATIQLPSLPGGTSDQVCLLTLGNCLGGGYGGGSYILNQTSQQSGSNFNIDGSGTIGTSLTVNGPGLFKNGTDSTTAFQVQNAAGTDTLLNLDTVNNVLSSVGSIFIQTPGAPTANCSYANYVSDINALGADSYWNMEDLGASAADSSGNSNTGTLHNVTVNQTPGPFSCANTHPAMSYNGTTSYTTTPNTHNNPPTYSEIVMFKTTSDGPLISLTDGSNFDRIIYVGTDGKLYAASYNGSDQHINSPQIVNDGLWHEAVAVFSTSTGTTLYLDGNQVASNPGYNSFDNLTNTYWQFGTTPWVYYANSVQNYAGEIGQTTTVPAIISGSAILNLAIAGGFAGIDPTAPPATLTVEGGALFQSPLTNSTLLDVDTTNFRVGIGASATNGLLTVGTNTTAASGGIYFGSDTNLYRSGNSQLATDSQLLVKTASNSTTAFQVQNAAGTSNLLVADTTNSRIGVNRAPAAASLEVASSGSNDILDLYNGSTLRTQLNSLGNQQWWLNDGSGEVGSISYTTPSSQPGITFKNASGTGRTDIRMLGTSGGLAIGATTGGGTPPKQFTLDTNGAVEFKNSTNTTNAFQIQNAAGTSNLLVADTTNTRIGIGVTPATSLLTIGTNTTTAAGGISFGTDTDLYRINSGILATDSTFLTSVASTGTIGLAVNVSGDSGGRFQAYGDGSLHWGTGGGGMDTDLYRAGSGILATDSIFIALGASTSNIGLATTVNGDSTGRYNVLADGTTLWGSGSSAQDVTLSRSGVGSLATKSLTDSTTAFQIQDHTGAALLTADTTTLTLTVQALVVNVTLTVNGHIITGNSSGSTSTTNGAQATCTVTGNDTGGTIQIVTSGTPISGTQCTINFANAFSATPNPVISPKTANAVGLFYTGTVGTSSFTIDSASTAGIGTTYQLNYFNAQ